MISYIHLKNFKSFADITLDLRGSHKLPKKIAFIYGANGAGKTNLITSIVFLIQTLETLGISNILKENTLKTTLDNNTNSFNILSLSNIINLYKMIDSTEPLVFEIGFRIDDNDGVYYLECSNNEVIEEKLFYKIKNTTRKVFSIKNNDNTLSPSIFTNKKYNKELKENIKKYWGKHTFLAILYNEFLEKNSSYLYNKIDEKILKILNFFENISVNYKRNYLETSKIRIPRELALLVDLAKGQIHINSILLLERTEKLLNDLFTRIYSEVKRVYYKQKKQDDYINYELHFEKLIEGKILDIPVYLESTGTIKLLYTIPLLIAGLNNVACIDEIDSSIHDALMKEIIDYLIESIKGQIIITTHNTLLLESLPSEFTYIINIDFKGNKVIRCVDNYLKKDQKKQRIKYLRGDYGGIPAVDFIDFEDIINSINDSLGENNA